jgi:hypothetical protein
LCAFFFFFFFLSLLLLILLFFCRCRGINRIKLVPPSPAVNDEISLVNAVAILADYGVPLLPLQVRLHKNRLQLLELVLRTNPKAYLDSSKLKNLAQLLLRPPPAQLALQVEELVAQDAFNRKDYAFAVSACLKLVKASFQPAWAICLKLASVDDPQQVPDSSLSALIEFALCYCPVERLDEGLASLHRAQSRRLNAAANPEMEGQLRHQARQQQLVAAAGPALDELLVACAQKCFPADPRFATSCLLCVSDESAVGATFDGQLAGCTSAADALRVLRYTRFSLGLRLIAQEKHATVQELKEWVANAAQVEHEAARIVEARLSENASAMVQAFRRSTDWQATAAELAQLQLDSHLAVGRLLVEPMSQLPSVFQAAKHLNQAQISFLLALLERKSGQPKSALARSLLESVVTEAARLDEKKCVGELCFFFFCFFCSNPSLSFSLLK